MVLDSGFPSGAVSKSEIRLAMSIIRRGGKRERLGTYRHEADSETQKSVLRN